MTNEHVKKTMPICCLHTCQYKHFSSLAFQLKHYAHETGEANLVLTPYLGLDVARVFGCR